MQKSNHRALSFGRSVAAAGKTALIVALTAGHFSALAQASFLSPYDRSAAGPSLSSDILADGLDLNFNGVRDDVERTILLLPENEQQKNAVMKMASAVQALLANKEFTTKEANSKFLSLYYANKCILKVFTPAKGKETNTTIERLTVNTKARWENYKKSAQLLTITKEPPEIKDPCGFE